jgi:hypothetical protein
LAVSPPSKEAVQAFVNDLLEENEHPAAVGDFQFVDLNQDGVYELVASLDYTGRDFYNAVVAVLKDYDAFRTQAFPAWNVAKIQNLVADLNQDGIKELTIAEPLSDYEGAQCMAVWNRIYSWHGRAYVDASPSFPQAYEKRLQELEQKIATIEAELSEPLKEQALSCLYLERDKIYRFLRRDPKAGLQRAVRWMKSTDPSLRRKAVRVFADIRDEESLWNLQILSRDPDPSVSQGAQRSLRIEP